MRWTNWKNLNFMLSTNEKSNFYLGRRSYYIHFNKCYDLNCSHCKGSIKNEKFFDILDEIDEKFGTLSRTILIPELYKGEHDPSCVDYQQSRDLREEISRVTKLHNQKFPEENDKCYFCNGCFQDSEAEKKRHKTFCLFY